MLQLLAFCRIILAIFSESSTECVRLRHGLIDTLIPLELLAVLLVLVFRKLTDKEGVSN